MERPILFSGQMVRAILEGRKTQTRRIIKPRKHASIFEPGLWSDSYVMDPGNAEWRQEDTPYAVGDTLWVREALQATGDGGVCYTADGAIHADAEWVWKRWSLPTIHCPKGLSRITIKVTGVKVERLQDISEDDAKAEGAIRRTVKICDDDGMSYTDAFADLWESINGPGSWEANPWVVAISFERLLSEGK